MESFALFLKPNAAELINAADVPELVKVHALEVIDNGYTIIKSGISRTRCEETIEAFKAYERLNKEVFFPNMNGEGHYPRIVNLHIALPALLDLFTENPVWLSVQDLLFNAKTSLYTSLFYHVGSQQPLHRDTPVFATRPEYHYFGTTVYLESANDENGCLEVLEGGHKMPELNREEMATRRYGSLEKIPSIDDAMWNEYQTAVTDKGLQMGLKTKKLFVEPGDSLIWHPQLPHGGSAIQNKSATRYSLVMHTTPEGVPVYHQNAFFNPRKEFSAAPSWNYSSIKDRKFADFRNGISFGHVRDYTLEQLKPL